MSDKLVRIKNRYDTAVNWETENPVLAAGEIGYTSNYGFLKIGDGITEWNKLRPINGRRTYCKTRTVKDLLKDNYVIDGGGDMLIDCGGNGADSCAYDNIWHLEDCFYQYIRIEIEGYFPINWTPDRGYGKFYLHSITDANNEELFGFNFYNRNDTGLDPTFLFVSIRYDSDELESILASDQLFLDRQIMIYKS